MKLNIGCGKTKKEGWENIDIDPFLLPDRVIDITMKFPYQAESIDEVFTSHTLEHISREVLMSMTLPEIWRVCKPDAKVTIIVPYMFSQNVLNHVTFFNRDTFRNWDGKLYDSSDTFPFRFSFRLEKISVSHEWMPPFKPVEICAVMRARK